MSLLYELKKKKSLIKDWDRDYMHIAVFDATLYRLGIDAEIIEQHKKEPPETWEQTLKTYEQQHGN